MMLIHFLLLRMIKFLTIGSSLGTHILKGNYFSIIIFVVFHPLYVISKIPYKCILVWSSLFKTGESENNMFYIHGVSIMIILRIHTHCYVVLGYRLT